MKRVWDVTSEDSDVVRHLPHYWFTPAATFWPCGAAEVACDFTVLQTHFTNCGLVPQHTIHAGYLVKLIVTLSDATRVAVVVAVCSFDCVCALTREPWPLMFARMRWRGGE